MKHTYKVVYTFNEQDISPDGGEAYVRADYFKVTECGALLFFDTSKGDQAVAALNPNCWKECVVCNAPANATYLR